MWAVLVNRTRGLNLKFSQLHGARPCKWKQSPSTSRTYSLGKYAAYWKLTSLSSLLSALPAEVLFVHGPCTKYSFMCVPEFNYTFKWVDDGAYGFKNKDSGEWNGLMGELLAQVGGNDLTWFNSLLPRKVVMISLDLIACCPGRWQWSHLI